MEVRDKIIQEFIRQFREKRVKDVKVDDIARQIGISKRTLYENFDNKENLIKESLLYFHSQEESRIRTTCSNQGNPMLQILTYMKLMTTEAFGLDISKIEEMRISYPEISDMLINQHKDFANSFVIKTIQDCQDEGYLINKFDPELLLIMMVPRGFKPLKSGNLKYYNKEFSAVLMFSIHSFTLLRGAATEKGIKICDEFIANYLRNVSSGIERI